MKSRVGVSKAEFTRPHGRELFACKHRDDDAVADVGIELVKSAGRGSRCGGPSTRGGR